jgi:hypothetical protein
MKLNAYRHYVQVVSAIERDRMERVRARQADRLAALAESTER